MNTITQSTAKVLRFSTNWNNKLYCKMFSTIRLDNGYYKPGEMFLVYLKNDFLYRTIIRESRSFLLHELPSISAALDTGYSLDDTKNIIRKMYPDKDWTKQKLVILLIENMEYAN